MIFWQATSDMTAAVIFSSDFKMIVIHVDRLHVDCHVGLLRQVVVQLGVLLTFKNGKLEDVKSCVGTRWCSRSCYDLSLD